MAYRKLTIRRMKPVTREGAKILNDLDGIRRRMKNWLAKVDTHGLCPWVSTVPPQRKIAPPSLF